MAKTKEKVYMPSQAGSRTHPPVPVNVLPASGRPICTTLQIINEPRIVIQMQLMSTSGSFSQA